VNLFYRPALAFMLTIIVMHVAGNGDPARAAAKEEGGSHQHVAHNEIDAPESPCGNAACSTEV
jgi:hypothetical protein